MQPPRVRCGPTLSMLQRSVRERLTLDALRSSGTTEVLMVLMLNSCNGHANGRGAFQTCARWAVRRWAVRRRAVRRRAIAAQRHELDGHAPSRLDVELGGDGSPPTHLVSRRLKRWPPT